jgi:hypothetical protein
MMRVRMVVEPYNLDNCRLRANGKTPRFEYFIGTGETVTEAYEHASNQAAEKFGYTEVSEGNLEPNFGVVRSGLL